MRIISERWDHKWDPAQEIPGDSKSRPAFLWKMHQFVSEHRTPEKQENRCRVEKNFGQPPKGYRIGGKPIGRLHHCAKTKVPADRSNQQIWPVNPGVRSMEVSDDLPSLLHRKAFGIKRCVFHLHTHGSRYGLKVAYRACQQALEFEFRSLSMRILITVDQVRKSGTNPTDKTLLPLQINCHAPNFYLFFR